MKKLIVILLLVISQSGLSQDSLELSGVFYPFPVENKWGFINERGESVTENCYDSILVDKPLSGYYGFIAIDDRGKYGFLKTFDEIKTMVAFEYDTAFYVPGGIILGREKHYWQVKLNEEKFNPTPQSIGETDRFFIDENTVYTYSAKGVGFIKNGNLNSTNFKYLIAFDTKTGLQYSGDITFWLVSDGEKIGLLKNNQQIIPCIAESIQPFDGNFIRYWIGYWVYVRVSDGYVIDAKGARVQIYDYDSWKIYDSGMQSSKLFVKGSQKFGSLYDDYFPIGDDLFAVRKNKSIGTIDANGRVLIPLGFDQITPLSDNYFKCLKGESWFLTDKYGVKISERGFDQLFNFHDAKASVFLAKKDNYCGVIDSRGKQILDCHYSDIQLVCNGYLALLNGYLIFFDSTGKKITGSNYTRYHVKNDLLIMFLDATRFDIFSKAEKLNAEPLLDAYFFDELVKGYALNKMEIISYNKSTGVLEENQRFTDIQSFEFKDVDDRLFKWGLVKDGDLSYLEENQLTGKFGFRGKWTHKLLIAPMYLEVSRLDFEYLSCVETYNSVPFHLMDHTELATLFTYDIISESGAHIVSDNTASSTYRIENTHYGYSSSSNRVNYHLNGKASFDQLNTFKGANIAETFYGTDFMAYNIGGEYSRSVGSANSIGANELYLKRNLGNNLMFEKSLFDQLFVPSEQVVLVGGTWTSVPEDTRDLIKLTSALWNKTYRELTVFESDFNDEMSFIARNDSGKYFWSAADNDTTVNGGFYRVVQNENDYFEVENEQFRTGIINIQEPQFVFVPSDSTEYVNGRILRKNQKGTQLWSVKNSLLTDTIFEILLPFNKNQFKGKVNGAWMLLERDGNTISDKQFNEFTELNSGNYEVIWNAQHLLLNPQLEELANLGLYSFLNDSLFVLQEGTDSYLWNPISQVRDTLKVGEELIKGSGFIVGKLKGKNYVRLFGTSIKHFIGFSRPQAEGSFLLYQTGKYYEALYSDGTLVLSKKKLMTNFTSEKEFIAFKSEKNWAIYNVQGKMLYTGKKGKSVNFINGFCVLEFQEETYALSADGSKHNVDEALAKKNVHAELSTAYEIEADVNTSLSGVKNKEGNWLIQPRYQGVSQISENEFSVQIPARKGLMSSVKLEIFPTSFDSFHEVDYQTWLVKRDQHYGLYNQNSGWVIPIR